jgi:hypothetical protein
MNDNKWIEMSRQEVTALHNKIVIARNKWRTLVKKLDNKLYSDLKVLYNQQPTRYIIKNIITKRYGRGEGVINIEKARNWFSFDDAWEAINELTPENRKKYIVIGIRREND